MKSILVIRFSSIGDIVLTSPVVRQLRNAYPEASIHYLTKVQYKEVVVSNPYLNRVITINHSIKDCYEELKANNYDIIIDLHKNIRSISLSRKMNVKTLRFNKLNIRKWLITALKINTLPKKHLVDRYFEALSSIGVKNDYKGLDMFLSSEVIAINDNIDAFLEEPFVTIVIGATYKTKQLTASQVAKITDSVKYPVVLVGGESDIKKAEKVKHLCSKKQLLNTCGKTNLEQSAYIVKKSCFVITHDTGFMHIAAAFDKPIISLWGNTIPEFGMYPYYSKDSKTPNYIIENNSVACRPCSKIGYNKCPKKHFKCIKQLDIELVSEIVNSLKEQYLVEEKNP